MLSLPIVGAVYCAALALPRQMTSQQRKYAAALISAKQFVSQWSAEHVYAQDALIVPFPTLAVYDPARQIWTVQIKAWLYLPFEGKKLKSYLPALTSYFSGKSAQKTDADDQKVDAEADEDVYEDALSE